MTKVMAVYGGKVNKFEADNIILATDALMEDIKSEIGKLYASFRRDTNTKQYYILLTDPNWPEWGARIRVFIKRD